MVERYLKTYRLILNENSLEGRSEKMEEIGGKIRYVNISIPDKLAKAIDEYMKNHKELDLRSRAQAVNFAFRILLVFGKKLSKKDLKTSVS